MENQNVNIEEKLDAELGLMLGEIAMQIGQLHQNYQVVAGLLKSRLSSYRKPNPEIQITTSPNADFDIGKTPIGDK